MSKELDDLRAERDHARQQAEVWKHREERAEHESELKLFYRARRILKEAGMPPEFSQETVDAWMKELALLQDERAAEYAEFKSLRDEQQKMSHIQYCVNRVIQPEPQAQEEQRTNATER